MGAFVIANGTLILPDTIYADLLARWPVARLATVAADGQPHNVPVVFCAFGDAIYSPLDGKRKSGSPGTRLKRFANVAANPKAALLLDAYTSDWQSLWWVRVDVLADRFAPPASAGAAIGRGLMEKYPQYQDPSLRFDADAFLRMRPIRISAWSQSDSPRSIEAALAKLVMDQSK